MIGQKYDKMSTFAEFFRSTEQMERQRYPLKAASHNAFDFKFNPLDVPAVISH